MVIHDWMMTWGYPHESHDKSGSRSWFLHSHLEEGLQLFHQAHTSSAVAGDVDAGQAADAGELRGLLEELVLVKPVKFSPCAGEFPKKEWVASGKLTCWPWQIS